MPVVALELEDITDTVLFLVSDAAKYITGATHVVDAGNALQRTPA